MPRKKSVPPDPDDKPAKKPSRPRAPKKPADKGVAPEKAPARKRAAAPKAETGSKPLQPVRRKTNRHTLKKAVLEKSSRSWQLPSRYGETKAVLLARDPYWIYAYWEITADQQKAAKASLGEEYGRSGTVLRVFQSPGPEGGEPLFIYDVEVKSYITSWYLNVHRPDRDYFIEIIQRSPSGRLFLLARSNTVATPRDFASPSPEKKWRVPDTLAKYFRQETRQVGVSSSESASGSPLERPPSGKGL